MDEFFIKEGILGIIILVLSGVVVFLWKDRLRLEAECKAIHKQYSDKIVELLEGTMRHGQEMAESIDKLGDSFSTQELIVKAVKDITDKINGRRS